MKKKIFEFISRRSILKLHINIILDNFLNDRQVTLKTFFLNNLANLHYNTNPVKKGEGRGDLGGGHRRRSAKLEGQRLVTPDCDPD